MKKIIFKGLLVFALSVISLSINAQMQIVSTGDVEVTKKIAVNGATIVDSVAINVKTPNGSFSSREFGVYSTYYHPFNPHISSGCHVGLVGQVLPIVNRSELYSSSLSTTPFMAGVAGIASSGCGVYGAIGNSIPDIKLFDNYAGLFYGNTRVLGTLTAVSVTTTSDLRYKKNINDVDSASRIISLLHPVSFSLRNDSMHYLKNGEENRIHYGLIAQEVKDILPEIVSEDGEGYLSVNYTELIPLLIKTIQELSNKVTDLQEKLEEK